MGQGYPTESDIDQKLSDFAFELIPENTAPFILQYKQATWALAMAMRWVVPLSVYAATPTTFNVRKGSYLYKGTVKTYVPGSAVDPTDNDTTYVWLLANNTIGSGIDGSGWPQVEHVKLAELDVDSDGFITDIRDLRDQSFLRIPKDFVTATDVVCKDNAVVCKNNEVVVKI
jgi:hypothetical protein